MSKKSGLILFKGLYSSTVERNTVNILINVQFILKALYLCVYNAFLFYYVLLNIINLISDIICQESFTSVSNKILRLLIIERIIIVAVILIVTAIIIVAVIIIATAITIIIAFIIVTIIVIVKIVITILPPPP